MSLLLTRYKFTTDDYHRMAEAGILDEDDRVELLDGEIIPMAPMGNRHAACIDRLTRWLVQQLGDRAIVRVQNPISLGDYSEPEPDVSLLRPRDDFYATGERHPGPEDVLLVIEVADSTIELDRRVKLPLYARHGITEVWLLDLVRNAVEVCRQPGSEGYRQVDRVVGDKPVTSLAFDDLSFTADALLGR